MKNKGFTLIELLAVIVILAIIALIAVPIILNIIGDTKESSDLRSAELYLDAVEKAVARYNLNGEFPANASCKTTATGLSCNSGTIILPVDIDGTRPEAGGTIIFENGRIKKIIGLAVSGKTYKKESATSPLISYVPSNEGDNILVGKTLYYIDYLKHEDGENDGIYQLPCLEFIDNDTALIYINDGEDSIEFDYTFDGTNLSFDISTSQTFEYEDEETGDPISVTQSSTVSSSEISITNDNIIVTMDIIDCFTENGESQGCDNSYEIAYLNTNSLTPLTGKTFSQRQGQNYYDEDDLVFTYDSVNNCGLMGRHPYVVYNDILYIDSSYSDNYYYELVKNGNGDYVSIIKHSSEDEPFIFDLVQE